MQKNARPVNCLRKHKPLLRIMLETACPYPHFKADKRGGQKTLQKQLCRADIRLSPNKRGRTALNRGGQSGSQNGGQIKAENPHCQAVCWPVNAKVGRSIRRSKGQHKININNIERSPFWRTAKPDKKFSHNARTYYCALDRVKYKSPTKLLRYANRRQNAIIVEFCRGNISR